MNGICAGIVLYNPDVDLLKTNIESILSQVDKVYLADNSSRNISQIEEMISEFDETVLIKNSDNLGIAAALNQLCGSALRDGFIWMMTLDQDTNIPGGLIDELRQSIRETDIAILCPAVNYEGWKKQSQSKVTKEEIKACMTSASLTRLTAWRDVGGFREDYFIDYVDNEFCMKLRLHQYRIVRINTCVMNHCLGETRMKKILGFFSVTYVYHHPWRYYYMIRNNYVFITDYKKHLREWKEWLKLLYIIVTSLFFTEKRKDTGFYIRKGIQDAKRRKMGKYRSI